MGSKSFMYAFAAAEKGANQCPSSKPLQKIFLQLKSCGLKKVHPNPLKAPEAKQSAYESLLQGELASKCKWCLKPIPISYSDTTDHHCPHCYCDLEGPGPGNLPEEYGVEWAATANVDAIAQADDLEAGLEASLREASDRATEENAPLSDALLRSRPVQDRVIVITYSRSTKLYREALMEGPELEGIRQALCAVGFNPELSSGAKVFVRPDQYEGVLDEMADWDLKPRHVIVAEEFEAQVAAVIHGLPSKEQIRKKNHVVIVGTPEPPLATTTEPESACAHKEEEEEGEGQDREDMCFEVERTFIHVKVATSLYSGPSSGAKTASTSDANPRTAINPRYR